MKREREGRRGMGERQRIGTRRDSGALCQMEEKAAPLAPRKRDWYGAGAAVGSLGLAVTGKSRTREREREKVRNACAFRSPSRALVGPICPRFRAPHPESVGLSDKTAAKSAAKELRLYLESVGGKTRD